MGCHPDKTAPAAPSVPFRYPGDSDIAAGAAPFTGVPSRSDTSGNAQGPSLHPKARQHRPEASPAAHEWQLPGCIAYLYRDPSNSSLSDGAGPLTSSAPRRNPTVPFPRKL